MVNEILMRGATVVPMPQPVLPVPPAGATGDFGSALLAELDGPAAPPAAPKSITLDTLPVVQPTMVAPSPVPAAAPLAAPRAASAGQYTVKAGDSLSQIARQMGGHQWKELYAANRNVIGANPNMIHPGQVLTVPAKWQVASSAATAQAAIPNLSAATPQAPEAPTVATAVAPRLPAPVMPPEAPAPGAPSGADVGMDAIDNLSQATGSQDHGATLREALKAIPTGHPAYETYKAKVDAYEAATQVGNQAGLPPAELGAPPKLPNPKLEAAVGDPYGPAAPMSRPVAVPPATSGYLEPTWTSPNDLMRSVTAGQVNPVLNAPEMAPPLEPQQPTAIQAPLPADPQGGGMGDGEEDWQAFS